MSSQSIRKRRDASCTWSRTPLSPVFGQLKSSINELLEGADFPGWNGGGCDGGRREMPLKATGQSSAPGMGYALGKNIHSKEWVLDVGTEGLAAFSLRLRKSEVNVEKSEEQHLQKNYRKVGKETGYESCYPASVLKSKNKNFHHVHWYKLVLFLPK